MTGRMSSLVVVVIAVLTVLGHVCAGPLHAHAGAVTSHAQDHDASHNDEAAHGGSCEALQTAPSVAMPALPVTRLEAVVLTAAPTAVAAPAPAPCASPPLFLLHVVLLI
jgi:hypothetical protein